MSTHIVLSSSTFWYFYNHQNTALRQFLEKGYIVSILAPMDKYARHLEDMGCKTYGLRLFSDGQNPILDFITFLWMLYFYIRLKPDIAMTYTIKPNIYGGMAAALLKIPMISTVNGLGVIFLHNTVITALVIFLYRIALRRSNTVFFHNENDRRFFVKKRIVVHSQTVVVRGSGVDLTRFHPGYLQKKSFAQQKLSFLLPSRMLWSKGIGEYIEAAEITRKTYPNIEFCLLGPFALNPTAISRSQISEWQNKGTVRYLGAHDDVRPYIAGADCIVLPSYSEGLSRALLEASAMGKPIITSDRSGCREVVEEGINGYLCQPRDAMDLAQKMQDFLALSSKQQLEMGLYSRKKAEKEFDNMVIINKYIGICKEITKQP